MKYIEEIDNIINSSIIQYNKENPEKKLNNIGSQPLYGNNSNLDSLDLVSFIVILESNLNEILEDQITLADERAMSRSRSPFLSIGTIKEYIKEIVNE